MPRRPSRQDTTNVSRQRVPRCAAGPLVSLATGSKAIAPVYKLLLGRYSLILLSYRLGLTSCRLCLTSSILPLLGIRLGLLSLILYVSSRRLRGGSTSYSSVGTGFEEVVSACHS